MTNPRVFCSLSIAAGRVEPGSSRRMMRLMRASVPHYTYVVYDRWRGVLYVGVTHNIVTRFRAHAKGSAWMEDAYSAKVYKHENRPVALDHERELIRLLQPAHNVVGIWRPAA